jgi:AcrR family transcriptional regulator
MDVRQQVRHGRAPDPRTRPRLIDVADRILRNEGSRAMTVRRVAAAGGTSTTLIYTNFGGMAGLVREIVRRGFLQLHERLASVQWTEDPVADMAVLVWVYRRTAYANRHLYPLMFGGASMSGFTLDNEDRRRARLAMKSLIECADRAIEAGQLRRSDPDLIALQIWSGVHGLVSLELSGCLTGLSHPDTFFETALLRLMVGTGYPQAFAAQAVSHSKRPLFDLTVPHLGEATSNAHHDAPQLIRHTSA